MDDVQVVSFNDELDILCYVTRGHASPNRTLYTTVKFRLFKYLQLIRRAGS